ncbi:MAG: hypothetical protein PHC95_12770 [Parabacteroides sp.]|nr:hypothetical protein [Parabacteroides sp.]
MGRAEKRRLERQNRILDKKEGKITLSRKDIAKLKEEITHDTSAYSTEALMSCFALALRLLYGFGFKRINRTLGKIDQLMEAILDDTKTIEDYKKQLEDETGIIIKCED